MEENYFENPQKEIEVFVEDITNITEILKKVKKIIRENQVLESKIDIFVQDDENLKMKIKCSFKEKKIFFYFPVFYGLGEWDKKTLDFKEFLESIDYEAVIYLADAKALMKKNSLKVMIIQPSFRIWEKYKFPIRIVGTSGKLILFFFNKR